MNNSAALILQQTAYAKKVETFESLSWSRHTKDGIYATQNT
jgi:hypothetical protein